jgi:hypothetical protein
MVSAGYVLPFTYLVEALRRSRLHAPYIGSLSHLSNGQVLFWLMDNGGNGSRLPGNARHHRAFRGRQWQTGSANGPLVRESRALRQP